MPRPHVPDSGLLETESFPYAARESGRELGLYDTAVIYTNTESDDGGGDVTGSWSAGSSVDARIDDLTGGATMRGGALNENTTHIVTFRDGQSIETNQRIGIAGAIWAVTALREHTDELVVRVEVMKL